MCKPVAMFHIELTCARDTVWRYNLTEEALYATVLARWARGEPVKLGEHVWRAEETTITIVDGPELPPGLLTMGRGWLNAKRQGKDVTAETMATFRERQAAAQPTARGTGNGRGREGVELLRERRSQAGGSAAATSVRGSEVEGGSAESAEPADVLADAFGLELLKTLAGGPLSLNAVWRLCGEHHPELEPGGSLALAMKAVGSLVSWKLATLAEGDGAGAADPEGKLERRISDIASWTADSGRSALEIHRV
jgi:hypothetical protein